MRKIIGLYLELQQKLGMEILVVLELQYRGLVQIQVLGALGQVVVVLQLDLLFLREHPLVVLDLI